MKRRNGFTLIELLAVIVILAIIAVIATPIIVGIIEDARESAAADSAYGALDAVEKYYTQSLLGTTPATLPLTVTWTNGTASPAVTMSGTQPTSGTVVLAADGSFTVTNLVVNGYSCTYENQKFSCPNKAS